MSSDSEKKPLVLQSDQLLTLARHAHKLYAGTERIDNPLSTSPNSKMIWQCVPELVFSLDATGFKAGERSTDGADQAPTQQFCQVLKITHTSSDFDRSKETRSVNPNAASLLGNLIQYDNPLMFVLERLRKPDLKHCDENASYIKDPHHKPNGMWSPVMSALQPLS